ncbi:hypothetical protein JOC94_001814 [Bacillus thermophilus]|uniref:Uncharacterized protein n=1 Tax=Siminovitchia thermophila TaxID=1245522 RepID=A0ABS2R5F3_9BACI|nr:hypothetical protein [Siminovitchia thermophila]
MLSQRFYIKKAIVQKPKIDDGLPTSVMHNYVPTFGSPRLTGTLHLELYPIVGKVEQ